MPTSTISAPDLARELGVDPRTFRRFLRQYLPESAQPGSSKGRYRLDRRQARTAKLLWEATHHAEE